MKSFGAFLFFCMIAPHFMTDIAAGLGMAAYAIYLGTGD